jgi:Domain of unknown function (DUF4260)
MDTPVTGTPRLLLRLEGVVVLVAAVAAYRTLGASWLLFALLLLVPDVSLLGYLGGARVGAIAYNALHTYLAPAILASIAVLADRPALWPICAIWMAHIGMDRSIGLGLKFPAAFNLTPLGSVGRRAPTA